jgi:sec-independent protein translocase protein TatA
MFGGLGPMEIALIVAGLLLVFGPRRLPELGRSIGGFFRELRGSVRELTGRDGDGQP